jgi:hypothetical protein
MKIVSESFFKNHCSPLFSPLMVRPAKEPKNIENIENIFKNNEK